VHAVPTPAVSFIANVVAAVQTATRFIDQAAMHLLDQLDRQALARLAPGRVGERFARQMPHRRAGNVALRDLLDKPAQRIAGCENGVAEGMIQPTCQLIDAITNQKFTSVLSHACQC
jgi:hypothetical protein